MTHTSIISTTLALPIMNEQDNMMSNTDTAFENKTQGALIAPLRFIIPQVEKPVFRSAAIAGGQEEFFFETEEQMVLITDLRSVTEQMTLDTEGFALLSEPSTVVDFYDDSEVESRYYDEIRALLTRELGAEEVIIFDATRRSDAQHGASNRDGSLDPLPRLKPVGFGDTGEDCRSKPV